MILFSIGSPPHRGAGSRADEHQEALGVAGAGGQQCSNRLAELEHISSRRAMTSDCWLGTGGDRLSPTADELASRAACPWRSAPGRPRRPVRVRTEAGATSARGRGGPARTHPPAGHLHQRRGGAVVVRGGQARCHDGAPSQSRARRRRRHSGLVAPGRPEPGVEIVQPSGESWPPRSSGNGVVESPTGAAASHDGRRPQVGEPTALLHEGCSCLRRERHAVEDGG